MFNLIKFFSPSFQRETLLRLKKKTFHGFALDSFSPSLPAPSRAQRTLCNLRMHQRRWRQIHTLIQLFAARRCLKRGHVLQPSNQASFNRFKCQFGTSALLPVDSTRDTSCQFLFPHHRIHTPVLHILSQPNQRKPFWCSEPRRRRAADRRSRGV